MLSKSSPMLSLVITSSAQEFVWVIRCTSPVSSTYTNLESSLESTYKSMGWLIVTEDTIVVVVVKPFETSSV